MARTLSPPQIIPLTEAPAQTVNVTLGGQSCRINVFTKSVNVPVQPPGSIATDPEPTYENANPVFLDLYLNDTTPVVLGVVCYNECLLVIDPYLGFVGDLAMVDTQGNEDPVGVPLRLPPPAMRNAFQRGLPLSLGGLAPPNLANRIPGLGSRFLLTYWPNLR